MEEDEIILCPFCNEDMPEVGERNGWIVIACGNCGACGPYGKTQQAAWNRWRSRGDIIETTNDQPA